MNTRSNSRDDPAGWLVFRCPGSETGNLEDLLGEMGYKVWTPRVWFKKRIPRKKLYRVVLLSMLPSYLFVARSSDLKALEGLGAKHGFWGPMVIQGKRVEIYDKDLDGLREADDRTSAPKKWVDPLAISETEQKNVTRAYRGPLTDQSSGALIAPPRDSQMSSNPPSGPVGGVEEFGKTQDELRKGDLVAVSSGPLAHLQIVAPVDEVAGDRVCISPFGGRVWMPKAYLTRRPT